MEKKRPGKQYCMSQGGESQVTPPQGKVPRGAPLPYSCPRGANVYFCFQEGKWARKEVVTFPCATSDTSSHPLQELHASCALLCGFTTVWSVAVRTLVAASLDKVHLHVT